MRMRGIFFKTEEQAKRFKKIYEQDPYIIDEAIQSNSLEIMTGCVAIGLILNAMVIVGKISAKMFRK